MFLATLHKQAETLNVLTNKHKATLASISSWNVSVECKSNIQSHFTSDRISPNITLIHGLYGKKYCSSAAEPCKLISNNWCYKWTYFDSCHVPHSFTVKSTNQWQLRETCLHPMRCICWCLNRKRTANHLFFVCTAGFEITSVPSNMPIQSCQTTISKVKIVGWRCQATVIFAFLVFSLFLSLPGLLPLQSAVSNVEKVIGIVSSRNNPVPQYTPMEDGFLPLWLIFFNIDAKWQL